MSYTTINNLYLKYKEARAIPFNQEEFTSFLAFFPVLLIAASDGIVDRDEWLYCQNLAYGLGASFQKEKSVVERDFLSRLYQKEFAFLLSHLPAWEEEFLLALEDYFERHPDAKKFVTQTMYLFADASNGICEEEHTKMDDLCKRLRLDPEDLQPFDELKE